MYQNSIQSVALELVGSNFPKDRRDNLPGWFGPARFIINLLPKLNEQIEDFSSWRMGGREGFFWDADNLMRQFVKQNIDDRYTDTLEAVPWTMAAAILWEEEGIKKLRDADPVLPRYLFDLALDLPIEGISRNVRNRVRSSVYSTPYDRVPFSQKNIDIVLQQAEKFKLLQGKLRILKSKVVLGIL